MLKKRRIHFNSSVCHWHLVLARKRCVIPNNYFWGCIKLATDPASLELGSGWYKHHNLAVAYDVCGSVHQNIIPIGNPTSCNSVSKFYFIFV